jgi:hypothetical protein
MQAPVLTARCVAMGASETNPPNHVQPNSTSINVMSKHLRSLRRRLWRDLIMTIDLVRLSSSAPTESTPCARTEYKAAGNKRSGSVGFMQ